MKMIQPLCIQCWEQTKISLQHFASACPIALNDKNLTLLHKWVILFTNPSHGIMGYSLYKSKPTTKILPFLKDLRLILYKARQVHYISNMAAANNLCLIVPSSQVLSAEEPYTIRLSSSLAESWSFHRTLYKCDFRTNLYNTVAQQMLIDLRLNCTTYGIIILWCTNWPKTVRRGTSQLLCYPNR